MTHNLHASDILDRATPSVGASSSDKSTDSSCQPKGIKDSRPYDDADEWETITANTRSIWKTTQYPLLVSTLLCLTGILGFYLYAQTINIIGTVLNMPWFLQYPLLGILFFLIAIVAYAFYDFWRTYMRLRKNVQVIQKDLNTLRKQTAWADVAAIKYLKKYLNGYTLLECDFKTPFFDEDEIMKIRKAQYRLTEKNCPYGCDDWKERFKDEFQVHLDTAAWRRIDKVAKYAALKNAISPYPAMDMLITLFWSFRMLRDLCTIYNLRTGFVGTTYLLGRAAANTFVAGKLDEFEAEIGETITKTLSNFNISDYFSTAGKVVGTAAGTIVSGPAGAVVGSNVGSAMGKASAALTKAVTGRATVATVNYLLMRRLGYRAMQMLQPLH